MIKKKNTYIFLALLILFIVIASFINIVDPIFNSDEEKRVLSETVTINGDKLDVNYTEPKELDVKLTYGNIYTNFITITNNNNHDIIYGIKFNEANLSNDEVVYDISISYDGTNYIEATKGKKLIANTYVIYNLVIPKQSTNSIKIVIKSLHENEETSIKGKLLVTNNLSSLDLFNVSINYLNEALEDKINKLNGITTKGNYYLNINDLSFTNDALLKGYIIVDASDISDIKYIYSVYNEKYMVKNQDYNSLNIINVDLDFTNNLNETKACYQYNSRVKCSNLMSLPKNKINNRLNFYNNSKKVINQFINEYNKDDDKTYVYDITKDIKNETNIIGYILKNKENMFIYIHDDLFMISGYNYNTLGDYNYNSKTIRSYTESAFEISAINKNKVCEFSGYQECYDINNNRIGSGY